MSLRNKKGATRTQKINEVVTRRFHADLRRLKKLCDNNDIVLCNYEDADDDMICILSDNEYNIGMRKDNCASEGESYFVTDYGLIELHKLNEYEDIL